MVFTHGTLQGEVIGFTLSLIGAGVAYLFGKRAQPCSVHKLRVLSPGRTTEFYTRLDAAVVVVAGAILCHLVFTHRGPLDCLTSDISFSTTLKALLKSGM